MKKFKILAVSCLSILFLLTACEQEGEQQNPTLDEVSSETLQKISDAGFSTDNVRAYDGKLFVEGDIMLTYEQLEAMTPKTGVPGTEHYSTDNLVSGNPRTISVFVNMPTLYRNATDIAIARYNAENLNLSFQRVNSAGSADIVITASPWYFRFFGILGSAGFPTASGDPHDEILMTRAFYDNVQNINGLATTIAHEMGHCIGFRHTDFADRSFSCGGATDNEGNGGVGANYIPGTPTGASSGSWMLACGSPEGDRPFTSADQTALGNLY